MVAARCLATNNGNRIRLTGPLRSFLSSTGRRRVACLPSKGKHAEVATAFDRHGKRFPMPSWYEIPFSYPSPQESLPAPAAYPLLQRCHAVVKAQRFARARIVAPPPPEVVGHPATRRPLVRDSLLVPLPAGIPSCVRGVPAPPESPCAREPPTVCSRSYRRAGATGGDGPPGGGHAHHSIQQARRRRLTTFRTSDPMTTKVESTKSTTPLIETAPHSPTP